MYLNTLQLVYINIKFIILHFIFYIYFCVPISNGNACVKYNYKINKINISYLCRRYNLHNIIYFIICQIITQIQVAINNLSVKTTYRALIFYIIFKLQISYSLGIIYYRYCVFKTDCVWALMNVHLEGYWILYKWSFK